MSIGRKKFLREAWLGRMFFSLPWLRLSPCSEYLFPPPLGDLAPLMLLHVRSWGIPGSTGLWGQLGFLMNIFNLSELQFP